MPRGIPPRTMSDISRGPTARPGMRSAMVRIDRSSPAPRRKSEEESFRVAPLRQPREWRYQTRPVFKRVRGPLVDVFSEAEEVLIVVDLGGFARGEISVSMTPEHYVLEAVRGELRFTEKIDLPPNVDAEHSQERLLNGVLEIVLPRKKAAPNRAPACRRREHKR